MCSNKGSNSLIIDKGSIPPLGFASKNEPAAAVVICTLFAPSLLPFAFCVHLQTHQSFFESGAGEGRWAAVGRFTLRLALRSFPFPSSASPTPNFQGCLLAYWTGITDFLCVGICFVQWLTRQLHVPQRIFPRHG